MLEHTNDKLECILSYKAYDISYDNDAYDNFALILRCKYLVIIHSQYGNIGAGFPIYIKVHTEEQIIQ